MTELNQEAVYRIGAVPENRWQVRWGSSPEPLATFSAKHAAVAYAMNLAREGAGSAQPMIRRNELLRSILDQSRLHE